MSSATRAAVALMVIGCVVVDSFAFSGVPPPLRRRFAPLVPRMSEGGDYLTNLEPPARPDRIEFGFASEAETAVAEKGDEVEELELLNEAVAVEIVTNLREADALEAKLNVLRSEQDAAAAELEAVLAHRQSVEEALQAVPDAIEEAKLDAARVKAEIDEMERLLGDLNASVKLATDEVATAQKESDQLAKEKEALNDTLGEVKTELKAVNSDAEASRASIAKMKQECIDANKRLEECGPERELVKDEISSVQAELTEAQKEVRSMEEKTGAATRELNVVKDELKLARESANALEKKTTAASRDLAEKRLALERAEAKAKNLALEFTKFEAESSLAEAQLAAFEEDLPTLEAEQLKMGEYLDEMRETVVEKAVGSAARIADLRAARAAEVDEADNEEARELMGTLKQIEAQAARIKNERTSSLGLGKMALQSTSQAREKVKALLKALEDEEKALAAEVSLANKARAKLRSELQTALVQTQSLAKVTARKWEEGDAVVDGALDSFKEDVSKKATQIEETLQKRSRGDNDLAALASLAENLAKEAELQRELKTARAARIVKISEATGGIVNIPDVAAADAKVEVAKNEFEQATKQVSDWLGGLFGGPKD